MKVWMSVAGVIRLVDPDEARISVFDHGFTVADGVFETIRVEQSMAYALTRHLTRLANSLHTLGLSGVDVDQIRSGVTEVLKASTLDLARLRITVTAGTAPLGSERGSIPPTIVIALADVTPWPATTSATRVPWVRNQLAPTTGAKTTSYADNVVALRWAHERGFSEGIFLNTDGHVSEGSGTNIFVVRGGEVVTPPLSSGCLAGITRELVLEWTHARECELTWDEVMAGDEVFLTSSTREVHPVTRLHDRQWSGEGPKTREVRQGFHRRMREDPDP